MTAYNAAQARNPKTYTLDGCKDLCDSTSGCKGGDPDDKSCVICTGDFTWNDDPRTSDGYEKKN
jgi:hypothetical protein